jgi:hypothetical protein
MQKHDPALDTLLDLDGITLVVDPKGGHWVVCGYAGSGDGGEAAWAGLLAHAARTEWRAAGWIRQRTSCGEAADFWTEVDAVLKQRGVHP